MGEWKTADLESDATQGRRQQPCLAAEDLAPGFSALSC